MKSNIAYIKGKIPLPLFRKYLGKIYMGSLTAGELKCRISECLSSKFYEAFPT